MRLLRKPFDRIRTHIVHLLMVINKAMGSKLIDAPCTDVADFFYLLCKITSPFGAMNTRRLGWGMSY